MLQAARVDTVLVRSAAMNKDVKLCMYCLIRLSASRLVRWFYLLHGYGGNARSWVQLKPELPQMADEKGIIFYVRTARTVGIGTVRRIAYRYETFCHLGTGEVYRRELCYHSR